MPSGSSSGDSEHDAQCGRKRILKGVAPRRRWEGEANQHEAGLCKKRTIQSYCMEHPSEILMRPAEESALKQDLRRMEYRTHEECLDRP